MEGDMIDELHTMRVSERSNLTWQPHRVGIERGEVNTGLYPKITHTHSPSHPHTLPHRLTQTTLSQVVPLQGVY